MTVEHFYYYHTTHNTKTVWKKQTPYITLKTLYKESQKIPYLQYPTFMKIHYTKSTKNSIFCHSIHCPTCTITM